MSRTKGHLTKANLIAELERRLQAVQDLKLFNIRKTAKELNEHYVTVYRYVKQLGALQKDAKQNSPALKLTSFQLSESKLASLSKIALFKILEAPHFNLQASKLQEIQLAKIASGSKNRFLTGKTYYVYQVSTTQSTQVNYQTFLVATPKGEQCFEIAINLDNETLVFQKRQISDLNTYHLEALWDKVIVMQSDLKLRDSAKIGALQLSNYFNFLSGATNNESLSLQLHYLSIFYQKPLVLKFRSVANDLDTLGSYQGNSFIPRLELFKQGYDYSRDLNLLADYVLRTKYQSLDLFNLKNLLSEKEMLLKQGIKIFQEV